MTPLNLPAVETWNAAIQRSIDAYAQDQSRAAGICVTCDNPGGKTHRECRRCRYLRTGR